MASHGLKSIFKKNKYFDKKQIHNNVGHYLKSWLSKESDEAKKIEKLIIKLDFSVENYTRIYTKIH